MSDYLKSNPETITLHGRSDLPYDGIADGTVRPGAVVDASGTEGQYQTFAEGFGSVKRIAKEYSHTGQEIEGEYSDGEHMELRKALPGERYYMLLAADTNVSAHDDLVVNSNGELVGYTEADDDFGEVFGEALEGIDNSGTGTDPVFIQVEVA